MQVRTFRFTPWVGALVIAAMCALSPAASDPSQPVEVIDGKGRTVVIRRPATRIVITTKSSLDILEYLHADAGRLIVGASDYILSAMERAAAGSGRSFDAIKVGSGYELSIETIVGLSPDLVILPPQDRYAASARQLERLGIPVVWQRGDDPTVPMVDQIVGDMQMIGSAIGLPEPASEYARFYEKRYQSIVAKVEQSRNLTRPRLFLAFTSSGNEFRTFGVGSPQTKLLETLGADPVGRDLISGEAGTVSAEYLLSVDPEVYIAIGSPIARPNSVRIGTGIEEREAYNSLLRQSERPAIRNLSARQHSRFHGLDAGMLISPINIAAIETVAKWLHPKLFEDIDPNQTIQMINSMAAGKPISEGIYWISLDSESGGGKE